MSKVMTKLISLNKSLGIDHRGKLGSLDVQALQSLCVKLEDSGMYHSADISSEDVSIVLNRMCIEWPSKFAVLPFDLARTISLTSKGRELMAASTARVA